MFPTHAAIIVAHPDDDALFAGPFQIANPWICWQVVCATYTRRSRRGRELLAWQSQFKCDGIHFLGFKDDDLDLKNDASSFTVSDVVEKLKPLNLQPSFILTHSATGEYGHPHHRTVSMAVQTLYKSTPIIVFSHYENEWSFTIEVPDYCNRCIQSYPSQYQSIAAIHEHTNCCRIGKYSYL